MQKIGIYNFVLNNPRYAKYLKINFFLQGEYGASGTVKSWTDIKTKELYSGFPYSWSRCSDGLVKGEIFVAPCIT